MVPKVSSPPTTASISNQAMALPLEIPLPSPLVASSPTPIPLLGIVPPTPDRTLVTAEPLITTTGGLHPDSAKRGRGRPRRTTKPADVKGKTVNLSSKRVLPFHGRCRDLYFAYSEPRVSADSALPPATEVIVAQNPRKRTEIRDIQV